MKRGRKAIAIAAVLICAAMGVYLASTMDADDKVPIDVACDLGDETTTVFDPASFDGRIGRVSATYFDSVQSVTDLIHTADLIITGTAASHTQASEFAIAVIFEIDCIIAGDINRDTVTIYQVGTLERPGATTLNPGSSYVLFLSKQRDDRPDTYYIIGGHQGLFAITESGISGSDSELSDQLRSLVSGSLTAESLQNYVHEVIACVDSS